MCFFTVRIHVFYCLFYKYNYCALNYYSRQPPNLPHLENGKAKKVPPEEFIKFVLLENLSKSRTGPTKALLHMRTWLNGFFLGWTRTCNELNYLPFLCHRQTFGMRGTIWACFNVDSCFYSFHGCALDNTWFGYRGFSLPVFFSLISVILHNLSDWKTCKDITSYFSVFAVASVVQ